MPKPKGLVLSSSSVTAKRPLSYLAMFNDECDRLHSTHSFQFAVALEQQLNKLDDILARHPPRGGDTVQQMQERQSDKCTASTLSGVRRVLTDPSKSVVTHRTSAVVPPETRAAPKAAFVKSLPHHNGSSQMPLSRRPSKSRDAAPLNLSIPTLAPPRPSSSGPSPAKRGSSESASRERDTVQVKPPRAFTPEASRLAATPSPRRDGEENVSEEASRVAALREVAYQLEREIIMLETRRAVLADEIQILSQSHSPSFRSPPTDKLGDTSSTFRGS